MIFVPLASIAVLALAFYFFGWWGVLAVVALVVAWLAVKRRVLPASAGTAIPGDRQSAH